MDLNKEQYNLIDIFHHNLSNQINVVYTKFIQEVNKCITILLSNANASADVLDEYVKEEIHKLKASLKLGDKNITAPSNIKKSLDFVDEILKQEPSTLINPNQFLTEEKKDIIASAETSPLESLASTLFPGIENEEKLNQDNFGIDNDSLKNEEIDAYDFDKISDSFKLGEGNESLDDLTEEDNRTLKFIKDMESRPNLTYQEKRVLGKARLEYKRKHGLLVEQVRQKKKELKLELKKEKALKREQEKAMKKKHTNKADAKKVDSLSYGQTEALTNERMEWQRKKDLLQQKLQQKREESSET